MNTRAPDADKNQRIAKEYVDKQLETMREHGLKVKKISKAEYQSLIDQAASTIEA